MKPIDVDMNLANVARSRVNARLGLLIHLCVFLIIMTFLIALNLRQENAYFWAKWPLLGWGLGLTLHATGVILGQVFGNWREHLVQREMTKLS